MAKEKVSELSREQKVESSPSVILNRIISNIEEVIIGKRDVIELSLVCLLAKGHLLIEDVPGVGKTMLARSIAASMGLSFKRIQFTPDLLPSDITGVSIYNQKTGDFQFMPGPVFTNILLADEINRTPPRTQSSLLECMEEQQVTVDGKTMPLTSPFFVMATVNSIEYQGTYPLPEAQLDRFFLRVHIGYPESKDEIQMLERQEKEHPIHSLEPVTSQDEVLSLQDQVTSVFVDTSILQYIVQLVGETRQHPLIQYGTSPRGTLYLRRASQALAFLHGRDFVLPDDIKRLMPYVLSHRLILNTEARMDRKTTKDVINEILIKIPVPVLPSVPR